MIKVCFVILGLDYSGAENVLMRYLESNDVIDPYIIAVYNGNGKEEFQKHIGNEKVRCLNIKYSKNELRFFPFVTQQKVVEPMKTILSEIAPEILYINNTLEIALLKRVVSKKIIPCVGHIHDMKKSIGTPAKRYEVVSSVKMLDRLITVSEACKKSWGFDEAQVIYNGVSERIFRREKKTETETVIGYVGMLNKRKGSDILIQVIEHLGNNVKWHIAYNIIGQDMSYVLQKLQSMSNVVLYHNIPNDQMGDFYTGITALIIPSREDPLPTVAIEAMAAKVLVFGSDTGGIPELIGNQELLFKPDDVKSAKDKTLEILKYDVPTLNKYIDEQHARVKKLFSQEKKRVAINALLYDVQSGVKEVENENTIKKK